MPPSAYPVIARRPSIIYHDYSRSFITIFHDYLSRFSRSFIMIFHDYLSRFFTIIYHDFLDTNKDVVPDDLVAVFYKHTCNFGFATHLFGSELKALYASDTVPRGVSFRISPTSHTDL